jgi:flagellar hook-associated protein 3 FlgL
MSLIRVSDQTRYMNLVPNYNSLLAQQLQVQQQIASGQRLTRVDQDPVGAGEAQNQNIQQNRLLQDAKNISFIQDFSQLTSSSIDTAVQYIQRANELAVSGGDATKSPSDRANLADEVNQLIRGIADLGSQKYYGQYLFSGSQSATPAFTVVSDAAGNVTAVNYNGNGGQQQTEYSPGQQTSYNMLGSNENGGTFGVFRDTTAGVDVFQTLIQLRNDLTANPANIQADIQSVSAALSHLTIAQVKVGSLQGRLQNVTASQQSHSDQLAASLGKLENTDVAAAATQLSGLQTAYQAALSIGARVGQLSLLDYLR